VAGAAISGLLQVFGLASATSIGIVIIVRLGTLWYGAAMDLTVYLIFNPKRSYLRPVGNEQSAVGD
jgi:uncharacterized membrane protein YbhN (UPF0104 family)